MHCELAEMREMASAFVSDVESLPHAPEAGVAHRVNGVTKWLAGDFSGAKATMKRRSRYLIPGATATWRFALGRTPESGHWRINL
jgi:hypothetical protein